jgi:hypothetical protein
VLIVNKNKKKFDEFWKKFYEIKPKIVFKAWLECPLCILSFLKKSFSLSQIPSWRSSAKSINLAHLFKYFCQKLALEHQMSTMVHLSLPAILGSRLSAGCGAQALEKSNGWPGHQCFNTRALHAGARVLHACTRTPGMRRL